MVEGPGRARADPPFGSSGGLWAAADCGQRRIVGSGGLGAAADWEQRRIVGSGGLWAAADCGQRRIVGSGGLWAVGWPFVQYGERPRHRGRARITTDEMVVRSKMRLPTTGRIRSSRQRMVRDSAFLHRVLSFVSLCKVSLVAAARDSACQQGFARGALASALARSRRQKKGSADGGNGSAGQEKRMESPIFGSERHEKSSGGARERLRRRIEGGPSMVGGSPSMVGGSPSVVGAGPTTANTGPTTASTGPTTANTGLTTASTGLTTASTGLTTANTGLTTASTGLTTASTGLTTASTGLTTANTGPTTANTGLTTANTGLTTANTGLTTASTGLTTASTGLTTASTGLTTELSATGSASREISGCSTPVARLLGSALGCGTETPHAMSAVGELSTAAACAPHRC